MSFLLLLFIFLFHFFSTSSTILHWFPFVESYTQCTRTQSEWASLKTRTYININTADLLPNFHSSQNSEHGYILVGSNYLFQSSNSGYWDIHISFSTVFAWICVSGAYWESMHSNLAYNLCWQNTCNLLLFS